MVKFWYVVVVDVVVVVVDVDVDVVVVDGFVVVRKRGLTSYCESFGWMSLT